MSCWFLAVGLLLAMVSQGYSQCGKTVPQATKTSKWCNYAIAPPITAKPLKKGSKVGRQTVFAGPLGHQGYCQKALQGSGAAAGVALSTKYLGGNYKGLYPDPFCQNKCICVMIRSWDPKTSTEPYSASCLAPKYYGKTFKAVVIEQCSECENDHIDMLADAPWCSNPDDKAANAKYGGKRIIDHDTAWTIGTFISEWNFVPCSTDCTQYFGAALIKKAKATGLKKAAHCK